MGQRHQLFVIAKIAARYRGLAAVHHQWLYGSGPLRACIRLLKIFQAVENRKLLDHELAHALSLTEEDWASGQSYGKEETPFPFIMGCLILGAGYDARMASSENTNVDALPFNLPCNGGDNNDGITIIDITNPSRVRHCFMQLYQRDLEASAAMVPLTALEYVLGYYDEDSEHFTGHGCDRLVKDLSSSELIPLEVLAEAWPSVSWSEEDISSDAVPETSDEADAAPSKTTAPATLRSASLTRVFETAAQADNADEWLAEAEQLPDFLPSLKAYLAENPEVLREKASSLQLLCRAMRGATSVDLSRFTSLSHSQILELAEKAGLHQTMLTLDLSGNPNVSGDTLKELLPKCMALRSIYLFHTPKLPLSSVVPEIKNSTVEELIHDELYARPLLYEHHKDEVSLEFPSGTGTNFPLVQMCWFMAKEEDIDRKRFPWATSSWKNQADQQGPKMVPLPLEDALLAPPKIVEGVTRFFEYTLAIDTHFLRFSTMSSFLIGCAKAFAMSGDNYFEVRPIPAQLYYAGKDVYHSSAGYPSANRPLRAGQWSLMLANEYENLGFGHAMNRFRYAFVTLDDKNELQVADGQEFLRRVYGEKKAADGSLLTSKWDSRLQHVQQLIRDAFTDETQLTLCEEEEVQEMVKGMENYNEVRQKYFKELGGYWARAY